MLRRCIVIIIDGSSCHVDVDVDVDPIRECRESNPSPQFSTSTPPRTIQSIFRMFAIQYLEMTLNNIIYDWL